jgi:uroporphyrinogen III methyltransferase/synthase
MLAAMTTPKGVGRVSLLGAGPGDPELVTARALRRLREADIVLYDALVHPDLLRHLKPSAEVVFVGKRAGRVSERQASINAQLIAAAQSGKQVARLKGGDPYLFGRGSEEAEALAEAGIPFEVVPGVASPMAASAYTGISLTHRDMASSVAYVTATESVEKDDSAHDWSKLATATQTLVFFMGLRKLDSLMQRLIENGRDPDSPAAVVSCASLPSQRTIVATVASIAARVAEAKLEMPALTIVGPVVTLREHLRWFEQLPLFGKRVLVTRPEGQSDSLGQALRDLGAEPIELPTIRIAACEDRAPLERSLDQLAGYDWVIFTSVNGVRHFCDALWARGGDARRLARAKIAAIGPATAAALLRYGLRADVVPPEFRGEAVAEAMRKFDPSLSGSSVLLARAAVARDALPNLLREAGARVDIVPVYRALPAPAESYEQIRSQLAQGSIDIVTFTSPSTLERLLEALGAEGSELLRRTTLAAIGPITGQALEQRGLSPTIVAESFTSEGLVAALTAFYAQAAPGASANFGVGASGRS